MMQPFLPDPSRDCDDRLAADRPSPATLRAMVPVPVIGLLAAADIGLAVHLVQLVEAALAHHQAQIIPLLAACGCGVMTGAALLLTWLLFEDLTESHRTNLPEGGHKF